MSSLNAVQSDSISWADSYIFSSFFDNLVAAVLTISVHPSLLSQNGNVFLVSAGSYMVQCMSQ